MAACEPQHALAACRLAHSRWLERHDERQYFYVDATSFEIMRRERITEAVASDGDFSAAGFIEVRP